MTAQTDKSAVITQAKARGEDLLRQVNGNMYRDAYSKGRSLSAHLEALDPSDQYVGSGLDKMDAFERLLWTAGIFTADDKRSGRRASTYGDFFERAPYLVHEWAARVWRNVQENGKRAMYDYSDATPGSWERPYAEAQQARWSQMIAPAIPLDSLIALTTTIEGDAYRAYYLTHDASIVRMVRVRPGAEMPRSRLASAENTVSLYKYGRTLEATYEQLRYQRLNKVALHIAQMAVQAETDKVATVIDIMVNGDGNSSTAATNYNLTTLDSAASAGTLTLKGWIAFKMKFTNPYVITGALMQEAVALQLALLNTGSANIPQLSLNAGGLGLGLRPINQFADGVDYGWTADAPTLKIVGFDKRFGIERIVGAGSNVQEVERFTTRQVEALTISELEGYMTYNQSALKTLNVNA